MENIMDIIIIATLMVWMVVGIITIWVSMFYHKVLKPVMGPMMQAYMKMIRDELEED